MQLITDSLRHRVCKGGVLIYLFIFSYEETRRNCARSWTPRGLTRLRARLPRQFRKVREDVDLRYSEVPSNEPTLVSRRRHLASRTRSKLHLTFQPVYVLDDIPDDDATKLAPHQSSLNQDNYRQS